MHAGNAMALGSVPCGGARGPLRARSPRRNRITRGTGRSPESRRDAAIAIETFLSPRPSFAPLLDRNATNGVTPTISRGVSCGTPAVPLRSNRHAPPFSEDHGRLAAPAGAEAPEGNRQREGIQSSTPRDKAEALSEASRSAEASRPVRGHPEGPQAEAECRGKGSDAGEGHAG